MTGNKVGAGTTIVGPITILGTVDIGNNCWINRGFTVHGNGHVVIGNNCDIGPDVSFLTGGHLIGNETRRAGEGRTYRITIHDGCWIGSRSTFLKDISIGSGCVIAACACVNTSLPENILAGGVPVRIIRKLNDEQA